MLEKVSSSHLKYPCHPMVASLILNNYGSYDDIMRMSFKSFVYTYSCLHIQNVELELARRNK